MDNASKLRSRTHGTVDASMSRGPPESNMPSLAFSFASGENNIASPSDHGKHIPTNRGRRNSSVGNQSQGKANNRSTCGVRLDQCKSHCDLGMV